MEPLYTTYDVSRLLQVDASTVAKWINRGLLLGFRTPGGHRRVRESDLRKFLIAQRMPIPEELGSSLVRLVVVDHEKPAVDAIKRAFKPHADRFEVVVTTSLAEALLLVSEERPRGLLIDLDMPGVDGLEVVRQVRGRKKLEAMRIITMTARHSPDLLAQSLKAGAVICLPKPIDVEQVLQIVEVPLVMSARK